MSTFGGSGLSTKKDGVVTLLWLAVEIPEWALFILRRVCEVLDGPLSSVNYFGGKWVFGVIRSCYFKVDTDSDGFSYSLHVTNVRPLVGFLTIVLRESVLTNEVLREVGVLKP